MGTRNKIEDLRNHLFEVIEKLQSNDIDVDQAKGIVEAAKAIIESAKVEVDFLKVMNDGGNEMGTGFIPTVKDKKLLKAS